MGFDELHNRIPLSHNYHPYTLYSMQSAVTELQRLNPGTAEAMIEMRSLSKILMGLSLFQGIDLASIFII